MEIASHYDLLVIVTVFGALEITVLVVFGAMLARGLVHSQREILECQRLTRQVAGLVAQETAKLRAALRQRS